MKKWDFIAWTIITRPSDNNIFRSGEFSLTPKLITNVGEVKKYPTTLNIEKPRMSYKNIENIFKSWKSIVKIYGNGFWLIHKIFSKI
jgi:hypothetical protein